MISRIRSAQAAVALAGIAGLGGTASAVDYFWDAGEGNWNVATNWNPDAVPGASDTARINNGGTAVIDASQNVSTGFATMGGGSGTSGTLRMTGGMLTTNFDIRLGGEGFTAPANSGTGTFDMSGGTVFMNGGNFVLGFGAGGATGTFNLSGGSVNMNSGTIFALGNRGTGTVNQTGGSFYARGGSNPGTAIIQLGRNATTATGSGTYNLSGGDLTGARLLYGSAVATPTGSVNDFNLSGTGRLVTGEITIVNTNAVNTFDMTGGTLVARTINIPITNNGGTLAPATLFFGVPNSPGPAVPPPGTAAEVVQNQVGMTTFSGANSYTQTAGTLDIDIAGASSFDFVNIGADAAVGNATINGTIAVETLSGFDPAVGSTFDVLAADDVTLGAVSVTGTTPGGNTFAASVVTGQDAREYLRLSVVPIPEPTAALALLAGGGLLLGRSRRRAAR